MKRWLWPALLPVLLISAGGAAARPPVLNQDGQTLVPLRFVADWLGAEVDFDAASKETSISLAGHFATLMPYRAEIKVDRATVKLDTPAITCADTMFVPVRLLKVHLGAKVEWDAPRALLVFTKPDSEETLELPVTGRVATLRADLDGDGKPETAYHLAAVPAKAGAEPPEVDLRARVWVVRGRRHVFDFGPQGADTALPGEAGGRQRPLLARDYTGDGRPELSFRFAADDGRIYFWLWSWRKSAFVNLLAVDGGCFGVSAKGAIAVRAEGAGKPDALLVYDVFPEASAPKDGWLWWARWYTWQSDAYRDNANNQTEARFKDARSALAAMGINVAL